MPGMDDDPTPEARAQVTRANVESRAELLPEERTAEGSPPADVARAQAEAIAGKQQPSLAAVKNREREIAIDAIEAVAAELLVGREYDGGVRAA